MATLKIDDVYPKGEGNPIVVSFLNAYPTAALKYVPCTILEDRVTKEKIYACEIDDMLYTGKVVKDKHRRTVIVKRNKVTGRVAVIGTEYVVMKPELLPEVNETIPTETRDLDEVFASKQRQQHIKKQNVKVGINTQQMITTAHNVRDREIDLNPYTDCSDEDFYIPPIDRCTENLQDVYDVSKMLSDDKLEKIFSEFDGKIVISDLIPWIQDLVYLKNLSPRSAVLIVYANYLLNLYSTSAKDINKKSFSACPYSKTLNDIILKNFTSQVNGKILRPLKYKDKALCYAIVLILIENDFQFELDGLCQAMNLSRKTASTKVRATGARIVTIGGKKFVQLKLPLNNTRMLKPKRLSMWAEPYSVARAQNYYNY